MVFVITGNGVLERVHLQKSDVSGQKAEIQQVTVNKMFKCHSGNHNQVTGLILHFNQIKFDQVRPSLKKGYQGKCPKKVKVASMLMATISSECWSVHKNIGARLVCQYAYAWFTCYYKHDNTFRSMNCILLTNEQQQKTTMCVFPHANDKTTTTT